MTVMSKGEVEEEVRVIIEQATTGEAVGRPSGVYHATHMYPATHRRERTLVYRPQERISRNSSMRGHTHKHTFTESERERARDCGHGVRVHVFGCVCIACINHVCLFLPVSKEALLYFVLATFQKNGCDQPA